jgi:catechol 2,3-dioxygenase-like lactoylglutathione lyase family enzyme
MPENFRVLSADHTAFVVRSLDEAVKFWTEGLGGELLTTGNLSGEIFENITGAVGRTARKAIVSVAGQKIELLEYSGPPSPTDAPQPFESGAAHIALNISSIDAAIKQMSLYGWRPQGTLPEKHRWPNHVPRVMYMIGPDGATIELIEPAAMAAHAGL